MSYYFKINTAKAVRQMFPKIILEDLRKFPFKKISIDFQKPFIELADKIIDSKKTNPKNDTIKLEKQLDRLVYELYGLSDDEIKIVEEAVL